MFNIETYLSYSRKPENISDLIAVIGESVRNNSKIKNAGHESEKEFIETLTWSIRDGEQAVSAEELYSNFDEANIKSEITEIMNKCKTLVSVENTTITVFPTFSNFVKKEMGGVSGFTPDKNIMNIFVCKNYEKESLVQTVAHEYAHTISYNFISPKTLMDSILLEGLAEVFSEKITGHQSQFSKKISETEAVELFKTLPLEKEGWDEVRELFTGGKKYPLWAGYSISYYLIKKYIAENNIEIEKLLLEEPMKIISKIKTS